MLKHFFSRLSFFYTQSVTFSPKVLFLCALALGFIPGFFLLPERQEQPPLTTPAVRKELFPVHKSSRTASNENPSRLNPDLLLQKYETLSEEQIRAELLSLLQWERMMPQPDFQKTMLIDYLACRLGEREREAALRFAGEQGNAVKQRLLPALIQGWGKSDFDGAAKYLLDNRQNISSLNNILGKLSRDIARTDPEKAIQWGTSLEGGFRKYALQSIMGVLSVTQAADLPRYLEKMSPGDMNDAVLCSLIARGWAGEDWAWDTPSA